MSDLVTALSTVSGVKKGLIISFLGLCLIVYDHFDKHIENIPSFNKVSVNQSGKERGKTQHFRTPIKSDSRLEIKLNDNAEQKYMVSLLKVIKIHEGMRTRTFEDSTGQEHIMKGNETHFFQLNPGTKYILEILPTPCNDSIYIHDVEYRIIEYKQPNDKIFIMGSTLLGVGLGILI